MANPPLFDELISACESNNLDDVKKLVPSQISGDGPNGKESPLHICAKNGFTEIGEYLIAFGKASVKRRDKYTNSPMHYAAEHGKALFIQMLIKYRSDVNSRGFQLNTPMHYAAKENHANAFITLLQNNASLFLKNKDEKTAIQHALSSDLYCSKAVNPVMLQSLFEKFPEETRDRIEQVFNKGWPYDRFHNKQVYDILRQYMPDYLHLVLHHISQLTQPQIEQMLNMDWDVKILNSVGETTIHAAVRSYIRSIKYYVNLDKNDCPWSKILQPFIFRLIKCGADINLQNPNGETPFFLLCQPNPRPHLEQDEPFFRMVDFGSSVNICDNNGKSPLELLLAGQKYKCVLHVLKNGAKINNTACGEVSISGFHIIKEKEYGQLTQLKYMLSAGMNISALMKTIPLPQKVSFEKAVLSNNSSCVASIVHECGYQFSMQDTHISSIYAVNSLRHLAARIIRENLYPNAWVSVDKLGLPAQLRKFITFNHESF